MASVRNPGDDDFGKWQIRHQNAAAKFAGLLIAALTFVSSIAEAQILQNPSAQSLDSAKLWRTQDTLRQAAAEKKTSFLYQFVHVADSAEPRLHFTGYFDAYFAMYSDSTGGEFQKFPTSAPRRNQFGLNMLYFGTNYAAEKIRATVGLHLGDIPACGWSEKFNLIQEANFGIRIRRKLWFDGGFFRTHIGIESIQPRENICHSISVVDYFEPYFLSGAKLTYQVSDRWTLQLQAFNSFSTFIETNDKKAFGASAVCAINDKSTWTINTLYADDAPSTQSYGQPLWYNDTYYSYKSKKFEFGAEANFGIRKNSKLTDSTGTAIVYSGLISAKYRMRRHAIYGRGEILEDSDEVLTGPIENANHELVGINMLAATVGFEYKPVRNAFIRLESRYLHTTEREDIFYHNGQFLHYRVEGILAMGGWF